MCHHRHRDTSGCAERKPNFMTFLESQSQEFITFNPLLRIGGKILPLNTFYWQLNLI